MKTKLHRYCVVTAAALLAALAGSTIAGEAANELANPGFEEGGRTAAGWRNYGRGYAVDGRTRYGGRRSIKCTALGGKDGMGAAQTITYEKPDKRPIIVGGWSRAEDVSGGGDYCVFLDIFYDDGTPWWGRTSDWNRGTHDWEYNAQVHYPRKPVKEIKAFVFIRRTTGTAWFDDIKVCRGGLHVTDVTVASDYPRSRDGLCLSAGLTEKAKWRCEFLGAAGKALATLTGSGNTISWIWPAPAGAVPESARISAETPGGSKIDLVFKVSRPERPRNPVRSGYAVWTRSSMKKVYPTELQASPASSPGASITLARNECEGLQVSITPADNVDLKDVRIVPGRFRSREGDVFPSELIEWHVVGYLWVQTPSGHPLAPLHGNWCPDALLPAKPFDVPGGRTQSVWVNFFASEKVKPGTYRGRLTVRPANARARRVSVSVRVRNFALPVTPRMKTSFAIMDGFTRYTYGELTPSLRRRCLNIMLDHRLNPDDISRTEPPRIEDLLYARERGMNTFNILNLVPKPKGNPRWVCYSPPDVYGPEFNRELARRLDTYVAELRRHGLSRMAYFYGFDERKEEYDDVIKQTCKFLKERYPEVSTFTTARYMYEKREKVPIEYEDYMDWYCPLTPHYKPELSEKLRAAGKQVWWYVCCGPKYPYANFASVDYPSIESRLLGWMTYGYKSDGLLFWHVNLWGENKVMDWKDPYLDWKLPCLHRMTGDGVLTYPTPEGPVSCIRLENIRDGIEDYDYLQLLADLKGRAAAAKYFDRIVRSMTEYNRDPDELYKVRNEVAADVEAAM